MMRGEMSSGRGGGTPGGAVSHEEAPAQGEGEAECTGRRAIPHEEAHPPGNPAEASRGTSCTGKSQTQLTQIPTAQAPAAAAASPGVAAWMTWGSAFSGMSSKSVSSRVSSAVAPCGALAA